MVPSLNPDSQGSLLVKADNVVWDVMKTDNTILAVNLYFSMAPCTSLEEAENPLQAEHWLCKTAAGIHQPTPIKIWQNRGHGTEWEVGMESIPCPTNNRSASLEKYYPWILVSMKYFLRRKWFILAKWVAFIKKPENLFVIEMGKMTVMTDCKNQNMLFVT